MHILTVNQNYPEWVKDRFLFNLHQVGYQGDIAFFGDLEEPLCSTRMRVWLDFVKTLPSDEFIILSDLRDVLFQDNPEKLAEDGLHVFFECPDYAIADEPYNRSWILEGWGEAGLDKIGHHIISCAGVTYGRQPNIQEYLRKMCIYLDQPNLQFRGADQGIHNWMIWNEELDCTTHWDSEGLVYTCGLESEIRVRHHTIYDQGGNIPTIVHQYDRHLVTL